jgi:protoheme IX farnesyltransferase
MTDIRSSGEMAGHGIAEPGFSDFVQLLKPRVMSLVVFTALAGMIAAPVHLPPVAFFTAILFIALGAGASGALNMWWDADIDALMKRTARRPIPAGMIAPGEALGFGMALSVGSVIMLWLATNWVAAALLAFTIFFYVVVYSMGLKRLTPQNIVIGGAAGAFPPMVGWAAMTGSVSLEAFLMFALIFMWTPPHFWALSLWRSDDYARAGVPMLPVVKGKDHTRLQILLYTLVLVPLGLTPALIGGAGWLYLASAIGLGLWFLVAAIVTFRERDAAREPAARRLFGVSLVYLTALFASLIVEKLAGFPMFPAWWS